MRRKWVLLVAAGIASLALVSVLYLALNGRQPLRERYERIEPGMTWQEVDAIMGPPPPQFCREGWIMWTDGCNTALASFDFDDKRVDGKRYIDAEDTNPLAAAWKWVGW
jgi:hypothetical protein